MSTLGLPSSARPSGASRRSTEWLREYARRGPVVHRATNVVGKGTTVTE